MIYSLWIEGYIATGEHSPAQFLGDYEAETFREAVDKWNAEKNNREQYGELTWRDYGPAAWGCRIFDNEEDARRNFG